MTFDKANPQDARVRELEAALAMPRIRIAVNAFILKENQVLQVEFDDQSGPHSNFPGGGVEVGETLEEALHREVEEETCLQITVERLLLILESVGSRNTNLIAGRAQPWNELRFFFLCTPHPGSVARLPLVPDPYQTGVKWVPLESLPTTNVIPQISRQLIDALTTSPASIVIANPRP